MRTCAILITVMLACAGPAGSASAAACDPADPVLAAPPSSAAREFDPPVRTDPDGATTITLAVSDPAGGSYAYHVTHTEGTLQIGTFSHPWPQARHIVTHGLYVLRDGALTRVPLLLSENAANPELLSALYALVLQEWAPLVINATPFAMNTALPTSTILLLAFALAPAVPPLAAAVLSSLPVAGPAAGAAASAVAANPVVRGTLDPRLALAPFTYANAWPLPDGYTDLPPVYIWSVYRTAPGAQAWQGVAVTHNGSFAPREGCRRTRVLAVTRTADATTAVGGIYLLDHAVSSDDGSSFTADQHLQAGMTGPGYTDVPVAAVHQHERKQGETQYVIYPDEQRDEITIGVEGPSGFVPLIGTRADARHRPFSCEDGTCLEQRRLVSLGVYDPLGAYHPAVGARIEFDRYPEDIWALLWAFQAPGTPRPGAWRADLGTFNPTIADDSEAFVPVAGIRYDEEFPGHRDPYPFIVTAGVWTPGLDGSTFLPVLGATYDGAVPLPYWALANAGGDFAGMRRWLVSAGAFTPLGDYVPVAGASYDPGPRVTERYRVGAFLAAYPDFVPLAGADWTGSQTSGSWAAAYAGGQGDVPSDARVDAGPVGPDGEMVPVAGLRAFAGTPDRMQVGAWAGAGFVPLLEACYTGAPSAGLAAGPDRTPVATVDPTGPSVQPLSYC